MIMTTITTTIGGSIIGDSIGVTKGAITNGGNSTPASSNSGGVGDLGLVRKAQ